LAVLEWLTYGATIPRIAYTKASADFTGDKDPTVRAKCEILEPLFGTKRLPNGLSLKSVDQCCLVPLVAESNHGTAVGAEKDRRDVSNRRDGRLNRTAERL
jgi:hypothetical protein